jgi:hypothetical protein
MYCIISSCTITVRLITNIFLVHANRINCTNSYLSHLASQSFCVYYFLMKETTTIINFSNVLVVFNICCFKDPSNTTVTLRILLIINFRLQNLVCFRSSIQHALFWRAVLKLDLVNVSCR